MNNKSLVLYGNPTPSDFMVDESLSFSSSTSSTLSSTRSDAQSAPPELDRLFSEICEKSAELVRLKKTPLPPEWSRSYSCCNGKRCPSPGYLKDRPIMISFYRDPLVGYSGIFVTFSIVSSMPASMKWLRWVEGYIFTYAAFFPIYVDWNSIHHLTLAGRVWYYPIV